MTYLEKTQKFQQNSLISLDECVLAALELFQQTTLEKGDFSRFKKPLIAGSGNALVTAEIIFASFDALFCDESNFDTQIQKDIDGVIILSASGEKHAPVFASKARQKGFDIFLLTCALGSSAEKIVGSQQTIVTPKNREPYTYNTSTYMGWMLAYTGESAEYIYTYIQDQIEPMMRCIDFSDYDAYLLVTPDRFASLNQLFRVKFIELFGRKIARDVFSYEQMKHAITVVPHDSELAIAFGEGDFDFQNSRLHIPLPHDCDGAMMMAIGYYIIGKIQGAHPDYFGQNITHYIERINAGGFSKGLSVIVD